MDKSHRKKLIQEDAVNHKDSVFRRENCFNYQGRTYERLETPPENHPDPEFDAKYRFILGYDDYDYVTVGAKLPGRITPNPFESKESTKEFEKELDEAWKRWNTPSAMEFVPYTEGLPEMDNYGCICGPIPDGVDPDAFVREQADFYQGDSGPFPKYTTYIYDKVHTYEPGEAQYERVQGSYWLYTNR